jgi:oxygen-independent coproporphyrinogen-3 oxidase
MVESLRDDSKEGHSLNSQFSIFNSQLHVALYVHTPFCLRKCPYCDFYSVAYTDELADAYTGALIRAIETQPYGALRAETVYFGGGTPVLLGTARIGRVLDAIARVFSSDMSEITLEANPAAVSRDELYSLRRLGINRISFGVQSLIDGELAALGRLHSAAEARQSLLDAAAAGFASISADLMLAIPGQTEDSLARSVAALAALPIRHVSAYLLKIEESTPFWAQKNALALPDEDETADRYIQCVESLETGGFHQYEISNFARDNRTSRHNLTYWRCGEYLGVGPAAHSFLGGRRFYFPRELDAFIAAEKPFDLTVDDGPGGGIAERMMLALRLTEGFDTSALPPEAATAIQRKTAPLIARGLVRVSGTNLSLTPEGFLLSNPITASLLEEL